MLGGRHCLHGHAVEAQHSRGHLQRRKFFTMGDVAQLTLYKRWISAPPPREKYVSPTGQDQTMLEDESGRLRLVGVALQNSMLVTGCIIAVLGAENINGEFELVEIKIPDLPRQPQRWERDDGDAAVKKETGGKRKKSTDENRPAGGKVAIVSGLAINGEEADELRLDLLMEYLTGELGGPTGQQEASKISRLIIAGNALADASIQSEAAKEEILNKKTAKKYGYDASAYNPAPTAHLDDFLCAVLPTMPVTLVPGEFDPVNISLPQQPFHGALLPNSRVYSAVPKSGKPGWFDCVTNPWEGDIDGWRFLGNGGQPVDDMFKYVEGNDRIDMMEHLLRWRLGAPTAPDTLCKLSGGRKGSS
jgi:DNA polymerase delta subunit 2